MRKYKGWESGKAYCLGGLFGFATTVCGASLSLSGVHNPIPLLASFVMFVVGVVVLVWWYVVFFLDTY